MPPTLRPLPSPDLTPLPHDDCPIDGVSKGESPTCEQIRVIAWPDTVIDSLGYDPRSLYVELFWLSVLGPTSTWLMRRVAAGLDEDPAGFDLDVEAVARSLGLGGRLGRNSPFERALARCVRFDVARRPRSAVLAVRRRIPPLPHRHLVRLPPTLQASHRSWMAQVQRGPTLDDTRRRARRLAVRMLEAGERAQVVELELIRYRVHPAVAHEATVWATTALPNNEPSDEHAHGPVDDRASGRVEDAARH